MIADIRLFVRDLDRQRPPLAEIEHRRTLVNTLLADAEAIASTLLARMPSTHDDRRWTEAEAQDAQVARRHLALIEGTALPSEVGIGDPAVQQWFDAGKPTLRELRGLRDQLDAAVARERARVSVWSDHATRPYVYRGPRFAHSKGDGTFAVPGEIVQLSENQARSWADRFEPVG